MVNQNSIMACWRIWQSGYPAIALKRQSAFLKTRIQTKQNSSRSRVLVAIDTPCDFRVKALVICDENRILDCGVNFKKIDVVDFAPEIVAQCHVVDAEE